MSGNSDRKLPIQMPFESRAKYLVRLATEAQEVRSSPLSVSDLNYLLYSNLKKF